MGLAKSWLNHMGAGEGRGLRKKGERIVKGHTAWKSTRAVVMVTFSQGNEEKQPKGRGNK